MNYFKLSILCFMSLYPMSVQADQPFYKDHARGWFWYEDPENVDETLEKKPEDSAKPLSVMKEEKEKTAVERLKEVQEHLAELKAKAILEPTSGNVKSYQEMQMKVMNQSQSFSQAWVMNVFMNPTLDENVKNPTAQSARFVVYENERKQTESSTRLTPDTKSASRSTSFTPRPLATCTSQRSDPFCGFNPSNRPPCAASRVSPTAVNNPACPSNKDSPERCCVQSLRPLAASKA